MSTFKKRCSYFGKAQGLKYNQRFTNLNQIFGNAFEPPKMALFLLSHQQLF